tara:strand:- start:386 stop:664 length:279 start_codon:yes stop_codon:yes gene_type:complete
VGLNKNISFITMATYPVKNKETGETKDVVMSIHDWDQWRKDNPEWERYYTPENAPSFGEVGEWKDKLRKKSPGWNDVLAKAQKAPGSTVKKI